MKLNVRKHIEIKNGKQYTALEISLKLYCLDKRKVNYPVSSYYVGRSVKGLTTSLALGTKIPNKQQKARTVITDITHKYFRKILKKFRDLLHLGNKKTGS